MRQQYIHYFSFAIPVYSIRNYNWSVFNREHYNLAEGVLRLRLMKNHKINFFESPNPRHFNFHHLNQSKYHLSEDHEINEDVLFATPLKANTSFRASPIPNVAHYLNCPQTKPQKMLSEEICEEYSQQQNVDQQQASYHEIKEKLQFSNQEEELLLPTPLKKQQKMQEDIEATVRKQSKSFVNSPVPATPAPENRPTERGLKKLAAQAYKFVIHQKRTSYKQVARKLLEYQRKQQMIDSLKKGEMNVKRRVYDALNVLIALGLLRRNGNKVTIKREQMQFGTQDLVSARERQRRKELAMHEELVSLRQTYLDRENIIRQKRKLQQQVKLKFESIKELVHKNRSLKEQVMCLEKQKSNCNVIKFPLLVLSCNKQEKAGSNIKKEVKQRKYQMLDQKQQSIKLWQESEGSLNCSFKKEKCIQFVGELDVIASWKNQCGKSKVKKVYNVKRNR